MTNILLCCTLLTSRQAIQHIDLLVEQEKHGLLSFEDVLDDRAHLCYHGNKEDVVGLIHEALVVLDLVVEFLLDVVLHFMADQATGDFVCNMAEQGEIVRREVLIVLLVSHLKYSNRMISELNWDEKNITHDLVQLLIHGHVVTKFFPN